MLSLKEAFGAKIKNLRRIKGLTREELATMIGLNLRQLARIESGENFASAETIARLSTSLNISLTDLFNFEWSEDVTLLSTGTDGAPVIRLFQTDEKVTVQTVQNQFSEVEIPKQLEVGATDSVMLATAKSTGKPITVEYFKDKTRRYIKAYHPDGRVEVIISEKNVESETLQNYIKEKIKSYSSEVEKLEFVKLAADAINNPDALNELKILIRGIELARKN